MQFGFKDNHSTIMCSLVYKETINYYLNHGNTVYSCLLDASKAFDMVHFGRLFNLLIKRSIPFTIIHILVDSYMRQITKSKIG